MDFSRPLSAADWPKRLCASGHAIVARPGNDSCSDLDERALAVRITADTAPLERIRLGRSLALPTFRA